MDAVVVAGNLFDSARIPDVLLDWTPRQINSVECPLMIVPGNHDVHEENSVLRRFDLASRCPRALIIDDHKGSTVDVPGTDMLVWGRAMREHEPGFRPFAGLPAAALTGGQ
jgi:DNA repair exonuclease SbcCD nuclease subunit